MTSKFAGRSGARRALAMVVAMATALGCLLAGTGTAAAALVPGAPGGPSWVTSMSSMPTNFKPGEENDSFLALATNVGGAPTTGTTTVTVELPPEAAVTFLQASIKVGLSPAGSCAQAGTTVTCTSTTALKPGEQFVIQVFVDVSATAGGTLASRVTVAGGGAPETVAGAAQTPVGGDAAPGVVPGSFFSATSTNQAGAHPNATAGFQLNTVRRTEPGGPELVEPAGSSLREIEIETPPGLIGSTMAARTCSIGLFNSGQCPADTIVGTENIQMAIAGPYNPAFAYLPLFFNLPVYNLAVPDGVPAQFGFKVLTVNVILRAKVRSGGDYGLTVAVGPNSQAGLIFSSETMFYGVPADNNESGSARLPFIDNPTTCGSPLTSSATGGFWQRPGLQFTALSAPTTWTGCERVPFSPSLSLRPQTTEADSPTGLDVDLHLPQNTDPEGLVSGALKEARVQLPPGLVVNPASAAGLGACSEAQVGLGDPSPAGCPDNAKIGTVEIESPLLDHPMPGSIYVATPHSNPFGTLLAMYVAVNDPKTGITIKLPGRIDTDPNTGQLTVSVRENPQLPFEDVRMRFFGGPQAALKTPQACGSYTTAAQLVPWGSPAIPDANVVDSFAVDRGAGGGGCAGGEASEPNQPQFEAGSVLTEAGAESPMVVRISRQDGSQRFGALNVDLPKGLLARLAGVPYCSDAAIAAAANKSGRAEQASPSCPSASRIGTVQVAAGAGSQPYQVSGNAYLAGPYKGAPISLVVVTPAVAGPFDLGTVVVRTALNVDPITTQVSAKSDRLPTILDGIPLDLREVKVSLDRPSFTRNPTNCEPTSIGGTVFSALGGAASVSNRFQVGSCKALAFQPKLKLQLKGSTKRTGHPALKAVVTYPKEGKYANIARAQVGLPHSEFLDQGNLNKTCTKPVLLAGNCPKSSVYGYAKAWTPLLDKPLEGNVYLVGGYGYKLPALVAELNGQFRVLLVGRVDSGKNKGVRNTFEVVPDAPVSRFELRMKGGKKYGLLINSENSCRKKQQASALFTAQNGDQLHLRPQITNGCGNKKAHKNKGHRAGK